ncbi:MAG TPA: hypothetical protein VFD27_12730, partial [Chthoniobacteraceae bacterium]|nr:hypothetical protein [Chthoniobacteraceae bacterium]
MSASLRTTPYAASAIESIVIPWIRNAAKSAWCESKLTAVVVPFRSDAYLLKAHALAAGVDLFGLRFFTPAELREHFVAHFGLPGRLASWEY